MKSMRSHRLLALFSLVLPTSLLIASPAFARHRHSRVGISVHGGFFWGRGGPYWGCGYGPGYAYGYPPPDYAIIDTDIEPEKANAFLDGEEIGVADDYDGFPDYLEVSPGRHVLEFRAPGYRTLRITVHARRGVYYDIDRRLGRGEGHEVENGDESSAGPRSEDRGTQSGPERTKRPGNESEDPVPREGQGSATKEEEEEDREERAPSPSADRSRKSGGETKGVDEDTVSSTLVLRLRPEDAAVYLDGTLLGAGEAMGSASGVRVEPGRHTLEVVKPGFRSYRTTLVLQDGERKSLTVRLLAAEEHPPR